MGSLRIIIARVKLEKGKWKRECKMGMKDEREKEWIQL